MTRFGAMIRSVFALLLGVLVTSDWAAAQQVSRTPALLADSVAYDADLDALIATGNVEIYFENRVLRAAKVTYFNSTGKIEAIGPMTLTAPGEDTILADRAEIDRELQQGLIHGARLVLAENFQFAAQRVEQIDGRYSALRNTVASTCQVCAKRPTPLWLVRAKRIVRDNDEKQIHFEDVRFEVYGVTVAALPYFRIPDPSVARATGFLRPQFSNADTFGTGIKIPYFIVINDHSDLTITPFLTTRGTTIIEGAYRQAFVDGDLSFEGAFGVDDRNTQGGTRGFFFADGRFDVVSDYRLNFALRRAGDKSFLNEYSFSDTDRLTSNVTLSRQRLDQYISYSATSFQSLRASEDNDGIPLVAPEVSYHRYWDNSVGGGRITVSGEMTGLTRKLGRDVYKIGGEVGWDRVGTLPFGVRGQVLGKIGGWVYATQDDPAFPTDPQSYVAPTAAIDLRWPLIRSSQTATQVIEPVAQLVYRDVGGDMSGIPNEDSVQIEFDASNLFSLDRSPGTDLVEEGLRLNVGLNYTHLSNEGWKFGLTLGRVLRDRTLTQFATGTGLNGTSSNFVAAANFDFAPTFSLSNQTLFDDNLSFERNDIQATIKWRDLDLDANYVYLLPDASANSPSKRQEITLDAAYKINDNWSLGAGYRRNLASGSDVERNLSISYGNECITTDFSVSRNFTNSNNVAPSTEFGLSVVLVGFGGNEPARPAHKCSGF